MKPSVYRKFTGKLQAITPQFDDLIAQYSRIFVLHHAGRFLHLLLQAGNFLFLLDLITVLGTMPWASL